MGCAKDIIEHAAVPRFLFSDFPLGNSAGKPHDIGSQAQTLELALKLLETASRPADHDAVAAALERGCFLEARLQQRRAALAGVELARRRAEFDKQEGDRARQSRRLTSSDNDNKNGRET